MLTEDVHTYCKAITYYRVVDGFFLFSRLRPRAHSRCVRSGEDDKNPRTLNVRCPIYSCQDDNDVSEKEHKMVFDYDKREKDYDR